MNNGIKLCTTKKRRVLFFTVCDAAFLPRALSLVKSLRKFDETSEFLLVATEDFAQKTIEVFKFYDCRIIGVKDILDSKLVESLKLDRSFLSFMWTLPSLILNELIQTMDSITDIVYLDADIFFFDSPENIWGELESSKITIIQHRFPPRLLEKFPQSGRFNVSWVGIPRNDIGRKCARDWAAQCLDACPDIPTVRKGKLIYGDQLYLDDWPSQLGDALHIVECLGAGIAPWNYEQFHFSFDDGHRVNGEPLVFYHFSSHQFGFPFASRMGSTYRRLGRMPRTLYRHYECDLRESTRELGFVRWRSRYQPLNKRLSRRLHSFFQPSQS